MRELNSIELTNVTGGLTEAQYLAQGLSPRLARILAAEDTGGARYDGQTGNPSGTSISGVSVTHHY